MKLVIRGTMGEDEEIFEMWLEEKGSKVKLKGGVRGKHGWTIATYEAGKPAELHGYISSSQCPFPLTLTGQVRIKEAPKA